MANPHRGEVAFKAGDESHKLSFSANALCELEDALDMSVQQISELMGDKDKFRINKLRTVFWAGLIDNKPELDMKEAAAILSKLSITDAIKLVGEAFTQAFPAAEAGGEANPQQPGKAAQDGTGPVSTAPGSP